MPFNVGDNVYVPRSLLGMDENDVSPFHYTIVRERVDRSVRVDLPDGQLSELVATSRISDNFGILIIRVGDFNEEGLMDPLAKSVLNYARMLLPGDSVKLIELRTQSEFSVLWAKYHGMCKQVIFIGHGSSRGFFFGNDEVLSEDFVNLLEAPNPTPKEYISLACQTGYAAFGQTVSRSAKVSRFIAPFHSVHGCVASLFASTYLHERILATRSSKIAFNHARRDLIGAASFRLWTNGQLTAGAAL